MLLEAGFKYGQAPSCRRGWMGLSVPRVVPQFSLSVFAVHVKHVSVGRTFFLLSSIALYNYFSVYLS